MRMKAYLPNYIKAKNRKVIFDLFLEQQALSRPDLVRQTNMSFPTVLKVVDSLIAKNILIESEEDIPSDGEPGRKSHLLYFNPMAYCAMGVEMDGGYANVGLVNLQGDLLEEQSIYLGDYKKSRDLTPISDCINAMVSRHSDLLILGVGLGYPSNVNPESSSIIRDSLAGVTEETTFDEIFNEFSNNISIPLFFENDVNLACAGEAFLRRRQGNTVMNLVYLTISTGCGAGIMMDGKLRRGTHFKSGEVGNILLNPDCFNRLPSRSADTLEQLINLDAIQRLYGLDLRVSANLDDTQKNDICDYIFPYLATSLYNLITILDVDHFVLAGTIPEALGDLFYERLDGMLNGVLKENEQVIISKPVSKASGIVGGSLTVFDKLLFGLLQEE